MVSIRITGLATLPEIQPGDDLALLILAAAAKEQQQITQTTIVVAAQKIVSKAEGSIADLDEIEPSPFASAWAAQWGKDARLIEVVLRQSRRIVRMDRGVLITETHHGFVAANAGVDRSNTSGGDMATLLPIDPDASAAALRTALVCGAVIISDTFGRPWREGLVNVAIGVSGIEPLEDLRGTRDRAGQMLTATLLARADELASAAGLVMGKSAGVPVVLIEGYEWEPREGSTRPLIRPPEFDLFR
ncbi:MAG: coenzyme F420-0:L-glutamate ligase [Bryobacterales bacterium]|nr:coenzyme F420-0:L-glutamate ligase [Bryobacterales bacterium]